MLLHTFSAETPACVLNNNNTMVTVSGTKFGSLQELFLLFGGNIVFDETVSNVAFDLFSLQRKVKGYL